MRTRSTWTNGTETPRQAATQRHADIYTMNQEHPQPKATDYESGDPDSWAESPTTNKNVEQEYEGDHVKRNEVGFGEFRELASSPGHSARQSSQLVLYAGEDLVGRDRPSLGPALLDRPADVVDLELARPRVLVMTDKVAHIVADARVFAAFDAALHPIPHGVGDRYVHRSHKTPPAAIMALGGRQCH